MDIGFTYEDTSEYIAHYGVKGMKWGRRKTSVSASKNPRSNLANRLRSYGGRLKTAASKVDKKKVAKTAVGLTIGIGMGAVVGAAAGGIMAATATSPVTQALASFGAHSIGNLSLGSIATKTISSLASMPIKNKASEGIDYIYGKRRR